MSIIALLNQIKAGEIVLPAIQRDFVWPEDRIERLLDSVMRGYPIGIALLWETYLDVQHREFTTDYHPDNVHTFRENRSRKKLKVVLDGQQRLQSLYIALYGSYEGRSLYFDVLSGERRDDLSEDMYGFHLESKPDADSRNEAEASRGRSHLVPVRDLFQLGTSQRTRFVKQLCEKMELLEDVEERLRSNLSRFDEMLSKNANVLKVSVVDENLPSDSGDRMSEADVLEIFVRVNREGTPLSRSDLIFSILKLGWHESAVSLPEFVKEVGLGNSLALDADFVIRCLFAVSDLGTKFDIEALRKRDNITRLRERFPQCCDAIRSAVDFTVSDCGISNAALLGGTNTLVPLVYYLYHSQKQSIPNHSISEARKAMFLFSFAKPFSRYGDSRLWRFIRTEVKPAVDSGLAFPFSKALWRVHDWERYDAINERLLRSNVLLTHHIVQNLSGAKSLHAPNAPQLDHIFPRSTLRKASKDYTDDEINHFANFWILSAGKNQNKSNKRPAQYFQDVPNSVLRAAHIDRELLHFGRYRRFLDVRSKSIIEAVKKRVGISDDEFRNAIAGGETG